MDSPNHLFDSMLDETYPPYQINQYTYTASEILKLCDPFHYKQLYLDWLDQQPNQNKNILEEEAYLE